MRNLANSINKREVLWQIGLFSTLIFLFVNTVQAQIKSPKRGYGYGYNSTADLQKMAEGSSWWYNWSSSPDAGVTSTYSTSGVEFVPMCWGGNPNFNTLNSQIPAGAKYLLGFNEPNYTNESNMTPTVAAQRWPVLQQVAQSRGMKLVSPAVNYCGGGCNETDPIKWLDEFFAACPNCQVDFIGVHWYECTGGGLTWDLGQYKKYGKPLWLTEFSCGQGTPTLADQKNYMQTAIDILENDPDVFRYAWFAGRSTLIPNVSLLSSTSGQFTELGQLYSDLPHPSFYWLPGKIEAEKYYVRSGVTTETTTDVGGGLNVNGISAGDWMDYNVLVASPGSYNLEFRVASLTGGSFHIKINDVNVSGTIGVPYTGGTQLWTTIKAYVNLPQWERNLRIVAESGTFNINYFNAQLLATSLLSESSLENVNVYPNPFQKGITIEFPEINDMQKIEVYNVSGTLLNSFDDFESERKVILGENYEPGVYIVKCIGEKGVKVSKVIKN